MVGNNGSETTGLSQRVSLTRIEAAKALGVCPRMIDTLIAGRRANAFPVMYVGRKPLVPVDLLKAWAAEQVNGKNGSNQS